MRRERLPRRGVVGHVIAEHLPLRGSLVQERHGEQVAHTVVAIFPDGPQRYFDTVYNDDCCQAHDLLGRPRPANPSDGGGCGRRGELAMDERLLAADAGAGDTIFVGTVLPASVGPVLPDPVPVDVAALVKAAGMAEAQAEREARRREAAEEQRRCGAGTSGFGPVKPWVAQVGQVLRCEFDIATVGGVARRSTPSDHPHGLALDFRADPAPGDALAQCALDNMRAFSIKYVIWQQRINYGSGWEPMEDRGSPTANHMGHVHISFDARPRGGTTVPSC